MSAHIIGKSAMHLVDLLHTHNPDATDEQLADVVSEWGHLLDERPAKVDDSAPGEDASGAADQPL